MTYILAEIASAHMGDPDLCLELIHKAKEAGADGVKVQVWFPEEGDFSRMMDKFTDWEYILSRSLRGFDLWGQWYGDKSKALCARFCDRLISGHSKIFDGREIYGKQDYPTLVRDAHIKRVYGNGDGFADHSASTYSWVQFTNKHYNWGFILPAMAIAAGATLIEKHICLDREELKKKSKDWVSALEPHEFKEFVEFIREAETAL